MKYAIEAALPPPPNTVGVLGWMRRHLFNGPLNSVATLVIGFLAVYWLIPVVQWMLIDADWVGESREACTSGGACWVFISTRLDQFLYGFYPSGEYWRLNLSFIMLAILTAWLMLPNMPFKGWASFLTLVIYPIVTFYLLTGGAFDMPAVDTHLWGGFSLNLILAVIGIVAALPFGILLALGRRSEMPIVRSLSVVYIEIWRGVPLITVLFMASVMLPLFFPEDISFDKLLRAMIGIILFQSAYMAEVVRGGLQAIPKGQYEAADALGLSYWKKMIMIILPQALKMMIPGIVNTFIALFKDTSLVVIIGLFDLLAIVQAASNDPDWIGYATEGYIFIALMFWIFCFGMSRYSQHLERLLHTGHGGRN
ncbi:amino acid ABC transporter permease [Marinobacterium rhizophilum]|uniref:amino acid ABC transporter permease n=1 Tax=Marinobacterium rhizophilum TaxID=420402 RepID=UPI00037CB7E4|nr:amino acid ABC transporter permease [Marinobacterium rhizophilum]